VNYYNEVDVVSRRRSNAAFRLRDRSDRVDRIATIDTIATRAQSECRIKLSEYSDCMAAPRRHSKKMNRVNSRHCSATNTSFTTILTSIIIIIIIVNAAERIFNQQAE